MKENKELNPNTLRPWSLQGCVRTCMCACVTASLKGTPAQVSRQGSPHSRTVFWVHIKGNLSQMKYQARALARPVGEVTGASGRGGGDITNLHGEDSGQALAYGSRLCPLLSLCILSYSEGSNASVLLLLRLRGRPGRTSVG